MYRHTCWCMFVIVMRRRCRFLQATLDRQPEGEKVLYAPLSDVQLISSLQEDTKRPSGKLELRQHCTWTLSLLFS